MDRTSAISSEEYQMIRQEITDNIKKQDEIGNTIFVVLGLSIVFNNWIENVVFLLIVLLFSSVLLSKIIHCRNTVYYLSSYLLTKEALDRCQWEKKIQLFKKAAYKTHTNQGFIKIMFLSALVLRNLGNIALCSFVLFQIVSILLSTSGNVWMEHMLVLIAIILYAINVVLTIVVCIDRKIKEQYKTIWEEVLK